MPSAKRKRIRTLMLSGFVLSVMGCYRYSAASVESLRIGEPVRARISGQQAERLEPILGYTDRSIEGELLEKADSDIVIAVATTLSPEASAGVARVHQRIAIPRSALEEVEIRQLDRARTSLAAAIAAAGVAVAAAAVSQAIQLGQGGSRPNPNKTRLPGRPVIRIQLTR